MKSPFVSELELDKIVTTSFQVYSKQVREKKSGEPYLSLLLGDRTGKIDAKMWDNVHEVKDTFECNDYVKVRAQVQSYNNRKQLTVQKLRRMEPPEVDAADYLPASTRNPDEMLAELRGVIASMQDPHLRALLELFFNDEEIASRYKRAPAAKQIHHAYLGGLVEHVLSVCRLCRLVAQNYTDIDVDLLLAGAILHDIGKIYELGYDVAFSYTNDGQLLGHIVMGVRMVEEKVRSLPDFPVKLRTLLEHMILSHHGQMDFGSPKVPLFPEALLLHFLDDMDSKMECMRSLVEHDLNGDRNWTSYSSAMERMVLKKAQYLCPEDETPGSVAAPAPTAQADAPHPEPQRSGGLMAEKLQAALQLPRERK
jgi:3'-5' exoribonuclease